MMVEEFTADRLIAEYRERYEAFSRMSEDTLVVESDRDRAEEDQSVRWREGFNLYANPLDPRTRIVGGSGPITCCTDSEVVVVGQSGKWGAGATLEEALKNGAMRRDKAGTVNVYLFPGPGWEDIGVTRYGEVTWSHPAGWWPVKTVI